MVELAASLGPPEAMLPFIMKLFTCVLLCDGSSSSLVSSAGSVCLGTVLCFYVLLAERARMGAGEGSRVGWFIAAAFRDGITAAVFYCKFVEGMELIAWLLTMPNGMTSGVWSTR